MKSVTDTLLEMAITVLVVAILLNITWSLVEPMFGWLVLASGVMLLGRWLISRRRDW